MSSALNDILVVAIEQAVAAPYCSARLCEAGARVIKVERPGGDFARGYDTVAAGDSSYFFWLNQGKESLVLDFKQSDDAALLHRILAGADVLIQNLAPGAISRAGFDLAGLRQRYPRLITCDISGYGSDPTAVELKAYDLLVQGESGLIGISGSPGAPGRIGVSIVDIGAGMTAHAGILEALLERQQTGKGKAVEVSLFGVAADWMTVPLLHFDYAGKAPNPAGLNHPSIAPYGGYRCNDGETVIVAIQNEREWLRFCRDVLESESTAEDPRFSSNNQRVGNRAELDQVINTTFSKLPRAQLVSRLKAGDIAFGFVNSVENFAGHKALKRRSGMASSGTTLHYPERPIGGEPASSRSRQVPSIGQHTEIIKQEFSAE